MPFGEGDRSQWMKGLESEEMHRGPLHPWSSEPQVTVRFLEGGKPEGLEPPRLEGWAGPGAWWIRGGGA